MRVYDPQHRGPVVTNTKCTTTSYVVNLREQFGQQYKVSYEESYFAQHGPASQINDPGLRVLRRHHGRPFLWGGQHLAACIEKRGAFTNKLAALCCYLAAQGGEEGLTVSFDILASHTEATAVKPRGPPSRTRSPCRIHCGRVYFAVSQMLGANVRCESRGVCVST